MTYPSILLVEDNPDDEELTCDVLTRNGLLHPIVVARDGAEAVDYLFARNAYQDRDVTDLPLVVLLDLNLPKLSGMDVLRAIRADPRTRLLPVVILSSSSEDMDLLNGYQSGINSYVVKPVAYQDFTATVARLGLYWMTDNRRPPA
jgi:two-component system response regulator